MASNQYVDFLDSLKRKLTERRSEHLENMAKGREVDTYRALVGRAKECSEVIELIDQAVREFIKQEEGES
jgi:hypothetical protein